MTRIASILSAGVVCTVGVMVALCWNGTETRDNSHITSAFGTDGVSSDPILVADHTLQNVTPLNVTANVTAQYVPTFGSIAPGDPVEGRPQHPVTIGRPAGPPVIELTETDPQGRIGKVACSTCHSVRPANLANRTPKSLDEFHQGLKVDHGKLACYACHNPDQSDALRLADGSLVEYRDVMKLCSQCHSSQATAFEHGAHGGMNGHWDLTRGPQTKNNCVDCHDPHDPSYPKMIVGFKPRDRFLQAEGKHDDHK